MGNGEWDAMYSALRQFMARGKAMRHSLKPRAGILLREEGMAVMLLDEVIERRVGGKRGRKKAMIAMCTISNSPTAELSRPPKLMLASWQGGGGY